MQTQFKDLSAKELLDSAKISQKIKALKAPQEKLAFIDLVARARKKEKGLGGGQPERLKTSEPEPESAVFNLLEKKLSLPASGFSEMPMTKVETFHKETSAFV